MTAVEIRNVTKTFHERKNGKNGIGSRLYGLIRPTWKAIHAVDDVSFEIERGEIFGVVGPNGSGKSTLVRIMSTLVYQDSGSVTIFGKDNLRDEFEVKQNLNRVSVDAAFFKKLSVAENLLFAARLYGIPAKAGKEKVGAILEKMGFSKDKMSSRVETLSRGQQQKVAIARAFFTSPVLLLLDEPTTGLDPVSKRQVSDFIGKIRDEHDTTILLTTHDMEEADRLAGRVAVMDKGSFIAVDTPEGLKARVAAERGGGDVSLEDVFFHLTGREYVADGDDDED